MKTIPFRLYFLFAALLIFSGCGKFTERHREPVGYVDPYIGSIGHLLTATTPDVQLPRGMVRLLPLTTPGIRDTYLAGKNTGIYTVFSTSEGEQLLVKTGFSYISPEQARQNLLNEIPGWDFNSVKKKGKERWNDALGRIKIRGGTERERVMFYTALYRVFGRKTTNVTEYGKYYSIYDDRVHETEGHDFYQLGESWGSCRSLFPLGLILEPERQDDIINSYDRAYRLVSSGQPARLPYPLPL